MKGFEKFCSQFTFNEHIAGCIGVEREAFLLRDGTIVPIAEEVLNHLTNHADNRGDYGYELSACQLEDRIGPVWLEDLKKALFTREQDLALAEHALGFTRLYCDVAPATMPLDIYPDPTGRYQKITENMPRDILSAGLRVGWQEPTSISACPIEDLRSKFITRLLQVVTGCVGWGMVRRASVYDSIGRWLPIGVPRGTKVGKTSMRKLLPRGLSTIPGDVGTSFGSPNMEHWNFACRGHQRY